MRDIQQQLFESGILLDLDADSLDEAIAETVEHCVRNDRIDAAHRETIITDLMAREAEASTAIGHGVAVPHSYFDFLEKKILVFARLSRPLADSGPDGTGIRYVFLLIGPSGQAEAHLETLMGIARVMSDDDFRYAIGEAESTEDVRGAFEDFRARTAPTKEPKEEAAPELRRTGRLFGGVMQDIRARAPSYVADFRDGLHPKALGSTLFLYFACLAPAITFGGFMAAVTDGNIGAVEMLVATAIGGVTYALLSGQPLTILGGTGPLLVLTEVLYILCEQMDVPFLPTYLWVGLWTALFTLILAATDASALIRHFTRFTDEIFAALISLIFIVEALQKLLDPGASTESFLLSLLLGLATFYVATTLSRFRRSRFLHARIREFLADFGATIAVASTTALAYFYFDAVSLDSLDVPESLETTSGRAWVVDPMGVPTWVIVAAIGPAIVTTILVYLDQNITARLVNNKDHKLKRAAGYHLDLTIVGLLIGVFSLLGLPWLVGATVRSLNHLRSLATTEEVKLAGGEKKDRILHVRENRVTGLAIHLLIGSSLLFLLPYLGIIPMPVLYGLFLFMGIVSMAGNQFFERLALWIMDAKRYPTNHYTRRVPFKVIHAFTFLQALSLAVLWVVKTSALAILFPLFIALLVPIRLVATRWFASEHLEALDADEEPDEETAEPRP